MTGWRLAVGHVLTALGIIAVGWLALAYVLSGG